MNRFFASQKKFFCGRIRQKELKINWKKMERRTLCLNNNERSPLF